MTEERITGYDELRQDRLAVVYNHAIKKRLLADKLGEGESMEASVLGLIAEYENNIDQLHTKQKERDSALARVGFLLNYLAGDDGEQLVKAMKWAGDVDRYAARSIGYCRKPNEQASHSSDGLPLNYELAVEELRDLDDVVHNLAESGRMPESTAGQYLLLLGKRLAIEYPEKVVNIALQQVATKLRIKIAGLDTRADYDDKEMIGLYYLRHVAGHGFSTIRSLALAQLEGKEAHNFQYSMPEIETCVAHALEVLYPSKGQE